MGRAVQPGALFTALCARAPAFCGCPLPRLPSDDETTYLLHMPYCVCLCGPVSSPPLPPCTALDVRSGTPAASAALLRALPGGSPCVWLGPYFPHPRPPLHALLGKVTLAENLISASVGLSLELVRLPSLEACSVARLLPGPHAPALCAGVCAVRLWLTVIGEALYESHQPTLRSR